MVRPTAAAPSTGTFIFTEEHDCFLVIYTAMIQVEGNTLATLFNRHFGTSLSEETIARRARQLETSTSVVTNLRT